MGLAAQYRGSCSLVSHFGQQSSFSCKDRAGSSCGSEESTAGCGGLKQAFVFMTTDHLAGHPFSACLSTDWPTWPARAPRWAVPAEAGQAALRKPTHVASGATCPRFPGPHQASLALVTLPKHCHPIDQSSWRHEALWEDSLSTLQERTNRRGGENPSDLCPIKYKHFEDRKFSIKKKNQPWNLF